MLGTGNAFLPHQRHHSFLIFDGKHIIDAPPTALLSLRRAGISPAEIETIFITPPRRPRVWFALLAP